MTAAVADTVETVPDWTVAVTIAALLAAEKRGVGGVLIKARPGPARDRWLEIFIGYLSADTPVRRMQATIREDALIGGLDFAATLQLGRPVYDQGLLETVAGGVVILAGAERTPRSTIAHLTAAMDRSGEGLRVVGFDEGTDDDEPVAAALRDRLAFVLNLEGLRLRDAPSPSKPDPAHALGRLPAASDEICDALCAASVALGVQSLRAAQFAVNAARCAARRACRCEVNAEDAELAASLVLAHRATRVPAEAPQEQPADDNLDDQDRSDQQSDDRGSNAEEQGADERDGQLNDRILDAAVAAIPDGLLKALAASARNAARSVTTGKSGAAVRGHGRGRPVGSRRGVPQRGARLNILETLRAAAPWQAVRKAGQPQPAQPGRLAIRKDDLRITKTKRQTETVTIFVVDASGSSALHRLAEAKGAVELLLADCYVRRDQVALISFRGSTAEVLLAPTRSLARAKRNLAGLPGGGGTPLAAGIDAALGLAEPLVRRGQTPSIVFLTDGRANVALNGKGGRAGAMADAIDAAGRVRSARLPVLLVDTSPKPAAEAERVSQALGARYIPLPLADAGTLSAAVKAALPKISPARA